MSDKQFNFGFRISDFSILQSVIPLFQSAIRNLMWLIFLIFLFQPGFALDVELSKTTFKQGEILTLTARNAEEGKYICWLDKTAYPLYRIGKDTLRTFIGFGTDISPKTLKMRIEKGDFSNNKNLSKAKNKILANAILFETEEELWEDSFVWPVRGRITGGYGERRLYKKMSGGNSLSWRGIHSGIDIRQKRGTPIAASNSGVVIIAQHFSGEGNAILINHGQGVLTLYCHLDKINVKEGSFVKKGETIGKVGSTGLSTAPHLHFGLYIHATPVNPLFWVK